MNRRENHTADLMELLSSIMPDSDKRTEMVERMENLAESFKKLQTQAIALSSRRQRFAQFSLASQNATEIP